MATVPFNSYNDLICYFNHTCHFVFTIGQFRHIKIALILLPTVDATSHVLGQYYHVQCGYNIQIIKITRIVDLSSPRLMLRNSKCVTTNGYSTIQRLQ